MQMYTIRCNEEQLRIIRDAVELQMRIHTGQGWAITENLTNNGWQKNQDKGIIKELYDSVLTEMLKSMFIFSEPTVEYRETERDIWAMMSNALLTGNAKYSSMQLGQYKPPVIKKVEEHDSDTNATE